MLKDHVKNVMYRAMRPGLLDVNRRLERLEAALSTPSSGPHAPSGFACWRGGLSGHAIDAAGREVPAMTAKYRDELAFWQDCVKKSAERTIGGKFDQVYGGWQKDRIRELGRFLSLPGPQPQPETGFTPELLAWCRDRSAVEIGAGPYPSIATVQWRRAVAVDPLADGYTAEDLLPKDVHCDQVTYLSSPGEAVPLPSGFADIVVLENCLDHVDDPRAVVRECNRLLTPGGFMWLLVDLMEYKDHMHPNPFNEARLRDLLRSEGFEPVKDRISDHKSHPQAYGEYRGLLRKVR
ncbi:MAG: class I SAM-dependent methyltransferase [Phycisphaerales bacterium]|nr:class I SAM-dependent methyltransferase [Phycisphaerales bacterium]